MGTSTAVNACGYTMNDEDDGYCIVQSVTTTNRKNPKTILHPMKLDFPCNSVTAILGPSGSGKTTLLSVITDNIQSNVVAKGNVALSSSFSLVPQHDHLHGFYTCRSYMKHYARLSGAYHSHTTKEIEDRIDKILSQLGLQEQRDTIVGDLFFKGLSGGQMRRLSIALEVLTQPQDLFLDEPTSGLDSESALQVMDFLKSYARESKGRRVILTIHQPSSFIWSLIDHVILLSKGKVMFNGSRDCMEDFFESCEHPTPKGWNPADHYVTMVNDEFRDHALSVDEWALKYSQWAKKDDTNSRLDASLSKVKHRSPSIKAAKLSDKKETLRSKSMLVAAELTYRYFLNLFFNPGILGTRIAMYGMLAGMVGALFWDLGDRTDFASVQSRIAVLFYCVSFFIFMSVAVLPFTVMERDIVDKEIQNKYYHPFMYQIAQALSSIPGCALLALLVTVLIITLTKLDDPLWYFINMFLSLLVAEALAIMVSHVVPHFVIGMALIAGMYGFFMLFMGFMVIPSDFPSWLKWLYPVAFHTYSWRTFMFNEFDGKVFPEAAGSIFATGEDVLTFYEIEDVDPAKDMIVLVGYCLIIHLMSFMILYLRFYVFRGHLQPISGGVELDRSQTESLQVKTVPVSKVPDVADDASTESEGNAVEV